jgi:hypothetical protein
MTALPVNTRPKIRLAHLTRPKIRMAIMPGRTTRLAILPGAIAAQRSAEAAAASAEGLENAQSNAEAYAEAAQEARAGAEAAQGAAEAAQVAATSEAAAAGEFATAAQSAQSAAESARAGAEAAEGNAADHATAAQAARIDAETAETGAAGHAAAAQIARAGAEAAETKAAASAAAAQASEDDVASNASAAAASAAAALASKDNAATAEANAKTAQGAAETAQTGAEAARTAAETAESNAEAAASMATTQAGIATTQAENASASASSAQTAETNAETAQTAAEAAAASVNLPIIAPGDAGKVLTVKATEDGYELKTGGGGAVDSVNGQTGVVVLNADHIDDASTTNKFTTAAEISKLSGIETGADATDAQNVGSSIHGVSGKTAPADADTVPLIDSAASNALKKVTWANLKERLRSYFDPLYYRAGNILGTVSQSGGVPTGAVIERGSNANGEYVRFADGTQICTIHNVTFSRTSNSLAQYSWTFPAAVVTGGTPVFVVNRPTTSGNYTGDLSITSVGGWGVSSPGATSANLILFRVDGASAWSSGSVTGCSIMSFSRWF